MESEAQRIAIAKACGIAPLWSTALPEKNVHCDVPDYLNDLNAMHQAEKLMITTHPRFKKYFGNQSATWFEAYESVLEMICGYSSAIIATAAQRAEAFLKTLGLWED